MQDLQTVFDKIQTLKRKLRAIKKDYRDVLAQGEEYQTLLEDAKKLRERKSQIEIKAKESLGKRWQTCEDMGHEIESEQEMLNDVAMTTLMAGKTVEVTDENQIKYEPLFTVRFKKAG